MAGKKKQKQEVKIDMAQAIKDLAAEKGFSEDSVKVTIENALKMAYKKTYGKDYDNAVVEFAYDLSWVKIYSEKEVVASEDDVSDKVLEIALDDARKIDIECNVGDKIKVEEDPKSFDRSAVTVGKQTAHGELSESYRDNLYNQYKDYKGEIVIGYVQREYRRNVYVDLGKDGKVEGVLPARNQSPRETYEANDRIKALVEEVKKTNSGVQLVLSRTDKDLVRKIMEIQVPEISDHTVEINSIVRDAGSRTKIAVSSTRSDVDPVGACVGMKGVRIQNVIRELEGERIDVLEYSADPVQFIKNALSPAEVEKVFVRNEELKEALAVVKENQLSLAIGKGGQNVKLANRLCGWNIDVKTEEQVADMDLSEFSGTRAAAEELFSGSEEQEIRNVSELSEVDERVAKVLQNAGLDDLQKFEDAVSSGAIKDIEGLTEEDIEAVKTLVGDSVEFVGEAEQDTPSAEDAAGEYEEEEYFCPECGERITLDMTKCPKCGCEIEFEFEDEEE
jgi:N utilization substance protein A